jgi:O-antigen ligase
VIILIISLPLIRKNDRVNYFLRGFLSKDKINLRDQDERILVWESAVKIVKNNLVVGVGIGDVQSELVSEYLNSGEDKLARQRLNAHNQFLEVLLEGGVIGFSIFLSILGFMIYIAINEKNLLYGLFILMMFVFFMFESILNRLAGVSFFSLFSFVLLHMPHNKVIPGNPPESRDSNRS